MGTLVEGSGRATAPKTTGVTVQVKRLYEDSIIPQRQHPTDAGFDLCARTTDWIAPERPDTVLPSGGRMLIPTGVAVVIPEGHVGLVCPRSGLAAMDGITVTNAPGIIDSGYRGELMVILQNTSKEQFVIKNGDRIAQLVVTPALHVDAVEIDELPEADRGDNGGGSTGV